MTSRGHLPFLHTLTRTEGIEPITLPRGQRIAGRITVAGRAPGRPLKLQVFSERAFPALQDLGSDVYEKLTDPVAPKSTSIMTDAEGRFALHGLPEPWRGSLLLPWTHLFRPGTPGARRGGLDDDGQQRLLELEAPREDLVLDVIALPVLTGRIIDPRDDSGVARMVVHGQIIGDASLMFSVETESDGRFFIPLDRTGIRKVTLRLRPPEGVAGRRLDLDGPFDEGRDLGDIALRELRSITLEVRDTAGKAIAGARALGPRGSRPLGDATDASGHTTLSVSPDLKSVRVGALGFAPRVVEIAPGASTVKVVLEPGTLLRVLVRDRDGAPVPDVTLLVAGPRPLFSSDAPFGDPVLVAVGATGPLPHSSATEKTVRLQLRTDSGGNVVLADVVPDVPLELSVVDGSGHVAASRTVTLTRRASREVELRIPSPTQTLVGRVVDPQDRPVAKAQVTLVGGVKSASWAETSVQGEFRFAPLFAPWVEVKVTAPGFATWQGQVATGKKTGTIRLARGHRLVVRVRDEAGRVVRASSVRGRIGDGREPVRARPLGDDHELRDLPDVTVVVVARVGGVEYTTSASASDGEATVTVPVHGSVALHVDPALLGTGRSVMFSRPGTPPLRRRVRLPASDAALPVIVETLLPGSWEATLRDGDRSLADTMRFTVEAGDRTVVRIEKR